MPDGNREIGVKITTSADLAAAQAANKELQQTAKVTTEAGKAAEETTKKKSGLKEMAKGLAGQFPLLAKALNLVESPLARITALGTAAIAFWRLYTAAIAEAGRKQAELDAISSSVKSFARELAGVKSEDSQFFVALKEIATKSSNAATEVERLTTALEKQRELQDKMEDIQLATEKAKLQERHEADPEAFPRSKLLEAEAAADERSRKRRADRELATRDEVIAKIKEGIAKEDAVISGFAPNDKQLAQLRRDAANARKRAGKSQEDFDKDSVDLQDRIARIGANIQGSETTTERAKREEALKRVQDELALKERLNEDAQRAADAAEARLTKVETDRQLGEGRVKGAATRREDLQRKLEDAQAEQQRREKFLKESIPAQTDADKAKAAAERAKEEREHREKRERLRQQQEDKLNKAAEEQREKEEVDEFRRKRGDFGAVVEQLQQLLSDDAEMIAALASAVEAEAEKRRLLEQQIADIAAHV